MTVAEQIYEQAKLLPDAMAQEALDFVLFLRARQERGEWRDLMNAQSVALAAVWDNEEDEAWNDVGGRGLVLLPFPFSDLTSTKRRPVLMLTGIARGSNL
jgi:hypothetical protein